MTNQIGFCHICGKKLKADSKQGLEISRGKHYKSVHDMAIELIDKPHFQVIYIVPSRNPTV